MDKGLPGQIGREVLRILLLEDRDADAELVERALRKAGFAYMFDRARGEADFLAKLDPSPHIIVSDYYVPGCDALHALRLVRSRGLDVPFILVSGVIGETRALEAMRLGATDFLLKDRLGRLGSAIRTALELTALRRAAQPARPRPARTESEFREAFDNAAIGMALTTLDGRWLHVNGAFCGITGYGADELELADCRSITHPEDVEEDAEALRQLLAGAIGISQRETRYLHKLGHAVWVQVTASLTRDRDARPLHRVLQVIDITGRRQTEARLARANRARKVMAECSHALAHAVDESQFLQEMCRIAVESGGYLQAYVGLAGDDKRKSVRPVAQAGFEPGYLDKARRSWSGAGRRKSVMGDVIASGQRFLSRDIFADPKLLRWAERAKSRGYQSIICLPLEIEGRPAGGISIYAREPDSFDSDEIELLEMLAHDIAYGIASLRARTALRESEAHFRATFEHAAVGVAHTTIEEMFLQANARLCEMLGYSRDELAAFTTRDLTHPEDRGRQDELRHDLIEGRRSTFSAEKRYIRKDGSEIWVSRTVTLARPAAGAPYLIQVMEDISERKRTEARLARLMRARRVMAECTHTLVHATDETAMLQSMCRIVVESGGYKMAWVGLPTEEPARPIYAAAHAGFGDDAPMTGADAWSEEGRYRGFMMEVLASGTPHIARDILRDKRYSRRQVRAAQHGFQSSIGLPLKSGGAILGALGIYAREADAFDEDEIGLLSELAADIAYGVNTLRTRVAREQAERAAREHERRLKESFEQAAVGISRVGLDGVLVEVNQKFCDMLGYSKDELTGKAVAEITHSDDYGQGSQYRSQLTHRATKAVSGEKRFVRKDGSVMWARRTMSAACDEAGNPQYVISVIEDITERKAAEEALRVSEETFRATFDQASVGIIVTGLDHRFLQVNGRYCEIVGYTREDLLRMTVFDVNLPENVPDAADMRGKLIEGRVEPVLREKQLRRKDGTLVWVNLATSLVRGNQDEPMHFVSVIQDITESKQAEERYRSTFDRAPVGIMQTAVEDDRILRANSRLCEMLGYTQDELARMRTDEFIHPDHVGSDQGKYRSQMIAGEIDTYSSERLYRRKDGSDLWVDRTVSLVRDPSGRPLYFIRIVEDINERKLAARRQAMEHSVTRVLAESASIDEARPLLLRIMCETLGWACGAYWQWDGGAELLRSVEIWHAEGEEIARFANVTRDMTNEAPAWQGGSPSGNATGGVVRRVWQTGAPVWFPDVATQPDFRRGHAAAKAGLHCAFGFPILAAGQPLGMMEFFGSDIKEPDEVLLQIVRAIGSQIGQFIQRKEAERALRVSEERYRAQFEESPLPMWVWDDQTLAILSVNQAAIEHYAYTREEFLGMSVRDVWVPDDGARYEENIRNRALEPTLNLRRRHRVKDGRVIDVEVTARRFLRGGRAAWLTLVNDISVRLRAEQALQESEEQFRQLANNIPQVFWITDVRQRDTLYMSPAAETLLGYPVQAILDRPRLLVRMVHPEDRSRVYAARQVATAGGYDETYRVIRPDGTIRWVHDRAFPVPDATGAVYRIAGIAEDITERKLAEERLMHLAHYDVLTSLPNRVLFYDRLRQVLVQAKRNQWSVGVMLIDVDRFKNVNDTLGHAVGDQLLQQVAERLRRSVRAGDTVGRLGGDEFAVVLSNLATSQDGNLVAQKVMASFRDPFRLEGGSEIYVTGSIGITLFPDDSTDQDTLIKNADAAMYRAKDAGRNAYRFYTPEMNARAHDLLSMESSLRRALDRREFLVYYQPKVSVATGAIVGVEALLRWQHPERGLVSPGEFMPVLEETGLIVPVGEWVIEAVCEQIGKWRGAGVDPKSVAINLSARQFGDKDLGVTIQRILEQRGIAASEIEFEITESSLMANTEESTRALEFLANLGVGLSIDDFGTGYSSLGYLKRFPLDALKIDRSFVRDITTSTDDATITRAVISMAHSLGLKVIAEGVETYEQIMFLAEHGCDEFQGYFFSRPLPAEECGLWLREGRVLARPAHADAPVLAEVPAAVLVDDDGR